jgi:hypothetical protein
VELNAKVAIIGAGSLRSGAHVLSSIFSVPWPTGFCIHLCDPHSESLDIHDRLARNLAFHKQVNLSIISDDRLDDAVSNAMTVILCFGLGRLHSVYEKWRREVGPESDSYADIVRMILLRNTFEHLNDLLYALDPFPVVINMVRPTFLSGQLLASQAFHVDWPEPLPSSGRVAAAHQILRWIHDDEMPFDLLRAGKDSPITKVLSGEGSPEKRFNSKALAAWLDEIERFAPNTVQLLLDAFH